MAHLRSRLMARQVSVRIRAIDLVNNKCREGGVSGNHDEANLFFQRGEQSRRSICPTLIDRNKVACEFQDKIEAAFYPCLVDDGSARWSTKGAGELSHRHPMAFDSTRRDALCARSRILAALGFGRSGIVYRERGR